MRRILFVITIFALLFCQSVYAYDHCPMTQEERGARDQVGGRYLSTTGNIHALWVNIKFAGQNGNFDSEFDNAIDENMNNITSGNLTDFFDRMSLGLLDVTGEVVNVETAHSLQYYLDNSMRITHVNHEVLTALEPVVDLLFGNISEQ